jgi:hypothetical protein
MLRRIFEPQKEEVTGGRRISDDEDYIFYTSHHCFLNF